MIAEIIFPFLKNHSIILSFLGGFITGETIILLLAFLSANDMLPLWHVLVFSTLGMYLSDFIPFTFGRFKFLRNFFEKRNFQKTKKLEELFLKYTKNNTFLALLYTKFIYGASIPALIYFGYKKTPYSRFAFYNLLVELIFVPLVVVVGWYSGKGFILFRTIFKDLRIAIFLLLVLVIFLFIIRKWIDQLLIKRQKKLI